MFAPQAFRKVRARAITADDYAGSRPTMQAVSRTVVRCTRASSAPNTCPLRMIRQSIASPTTLARSWKKSPARRFRSGPPRTLPSPAGIKAALAWTGSWYEADVAVDPLGGEVADQDLIAELGAYLEPFRRIGHDLRVDGARYVPIDLALEVCVLPHFLRGDVEARLLDAFSDRLLADGGRGFFHPDNLTFGAGLFMSRMVAAAQAVAGVMEVQAVRLARYRFGSPAADGTLLELPAGGVLRLSPSRSRSSIAIQTFPRMGDLLF